MTSTKTTADTHLDVNFDINFDISDLTASLWERGKPVSPPSPSTCPTPRRYEQTYQQQFGGVWVGSHTQPGIQQTIQIHQYFLTIEHVHEREPPQHIKYSSFVPSSICDPCPPSKALRSSRSIVVQRLGIIESPGEQLLLTPTNDEQFDIVYLALRAARRTLHNEQ